MSYQAMRALVSGICFLIAAAIIGGCAPVTPGAIVADELPGETPWPGGIYVPRLPVNTMTLEVAKNGLDSALSITIDGKTALDVGVKFHGQLDYAKPVDNSFANYMQAMNIYMAAIDENRQFVYMLSRDRLSIQSDRLKIGSHNVFFFDDLLSCDIVVSKIGISATDISMGWLGTDNRIYYDSEAPFSDYALQFRPQYWRPYRVSLNGFVSLFFKRQADAQTFADNLFYIKQTLKQEETQQQASFQKKAARYRALAIKPMVSEEQRKSIVQANMMTQKKEYEKALGLYLKAVDIDPVAYPEAYFNLALLSARMERYKSAIAYMRQYLELEPGAKDARSAQDKIYEWEMLQNN